MIMSMDILNWADLDKAAREATLLRPAMNSDPAKKDSVAAIVAQVRESGDPAIRQFSEQFDAVRLADFRVDNRQREIAVVVCNVRE